MSAIQELRAIAHSHGVDEQEVIDSVSKAAAICGASAEGIAFAMLNVIKVYGYEHGVASHSAALEQLAKEQRDE